MLSFDIRSLETKAVHVDGSIQSDDPIWEEGDVRPSQPVRVIGRLYSAGEGRFYFAGRIDGGIVLPCRLWLEEDSVEVGSDVHSTPAAIGADEAPDPDVFLYEPNARVLD